MEKNSLTLQQQQSTNSKIETTTTKPQQHNSTETQSQQQQQQQQQPELATTTTPPVQIAPPTKQRNKLKRCAAKQCSIDQNDDLSTSKTATTTTTTTTKTTTTIANQQQQAGTIKTIKSAAALLAMGGGFTTPTPTPTATAAALIISKVVTTAAATTTTTTSIATIINTIAATTTATTVTTTTTNAKTKSSKLQMQETLLEKDENLSKEKTEKFKLLKKDSIKTKEKPTTTTAAETTKVKTKTKTSTTSKFAEKLRRSFRRSEHKSLEIRKKDKSIETKQSVALPTVTATITTTTTTTPAQQQQQTIQQQKQNHFYNNTSTSSTSSNNNNNNNSNSSKTFKHSLNSLANSSTNNSCGGGHINPALLLDSPDEATPPEFAYQHLSSVATTNSSTSLESNFGDYVEQTQTQAQAQATTQTFWTWPQQTQQTQQNHQQQVQEKQQQQPQQHQQQAQQKQQQQQQPQIEQQQQDHLNITMGGGIKSKIAGISITSDDDGVDYEQQTNNEQATPPPQPPPPPPARTPPRTPTRSPKLNSQSSSKSDQPNLSPSCSLTSENSNNKIARLQNFKSSNESRSSYQGHSNEGFTVSSHNSSSGEWENVGACGLSLSNVDFRAGSFPEEIDGIITDDTIPTTESSISTTAAGSYYQYTLSSPNNPFLPEIVARSYHSTYEEPDDYLDANITSVKYISGGGGTHSHLTTRNNSRAGSQESTHSDSGVTAIAAATPSPTPSSTSSTPGRQRRKLFSLHSPTRHLLHQQSSHQYQHQQAQHAHKSLAKTSVHGSTEIAGKSNVSTTAIHSMASVISSGCTGASNLVRYLNPFHPSTSGSSSPSAKRALLKQATNVTSPTAAPPQDLNSKREEFLRATMKICLVVSPPSGKLQLKSKSLTHLDGFDSMVACSHATANAAPGVLNIQGKPNTNASNLNGDQTKTHELKNSPSSLLLNVSGDSGCSSVIISSASFTTPTTMVAAASIGPTLTTTTTTSFSGLSYKKKTSFMQRKRALLPRSEVSSSEYFSISFTTETGQPDEEFIPATKGVSLAFAISQALRRRNLSFSQISITDHHPTTTSYLEAGFAPLALSLDEHTDVEHLAGRHLIIIERNADRKPLQKAASFGSRARPARLLSSVSTEESSESALPGKQLRQRWSGLFGIRNPQQSQLCELLNSYSKNGVPQRFVPPSIYSNPEMDAALNYLDEMHKSWKDFVKSDNMSKDESKMQNAIWELVTTEVYYIHALQTVTDLFLACLEAIQRQNLLTDVDQHRLFANIREICDANIQFWTEYLYPMVAHSVATCEPMNIGFFEEGFLAFAEIFSPYTKYCAEQSSCQFYCKELNRTNTLFTSYLAWCESQKMCNRLRLADILVRPMQRLTKYSLLLAAIRKHITLEEDGEAIDTLIHYVEDFVVGVNNHLTQRQETERLKGVMARIESYDVIPNTNNENIERAIKEHSVFFDLCGPIKDVKPDQERHLFMEGDHRFKDHFGKFDVHCFLFTDFLLICKNVAKKGVGAVKVIRQPFFTDRLVVHHTHHTLNCVYLNEVNLAVTAFTLQCSEAEHWHEAMNRAKTIYVKLKLGIENIEGLENNLSPTAAAATTSTTNAIDTNNINTNTSTNTTLTMSGGTTGAYVPMMMTTTTSTIAVDTLSVKKSPMNSSFGSHVSSANNSHSGSVEWNGSRNISVDLEKTNSFSSDDGLGKAKCPNKLKVMTSSANTLSVQPTTSLVQSLPNLNLQANQANNLYHTYSNNTLLVPSVRHTRNLLSPNFHNVSYPPPSPTRTTLRRAPAIPENPPLVKTRNITSQSSFNWHQIPTTTTPIYEDNGENNETILETNSAAMLPPRSPPNIDQFEPPPPPNWLPTDANIERQLQQQHRNYHSTETDV